MKKYIFLLLTILLLIPVNVFAGTCEPDKISIESIELENKVGFADENEEANINGKRINLNLHMESVGDEIDYTIKVKNDSNSDFELNKSSFNLNTDYIEYEISTKDNSNIIPSKSTKDVHLRVQYKEEVPIESLTEGKYVDNSRMDISVTSDLDETTPTPSSTSIESGDVEVPNTFASSRTLLIVFIILLFGLVIYYYRNNKQVIITVLVLGMVLLLTSSKAFALCSTSINVDLNVEIEMGYATFKTGQEVNTKMKQFIDSSTTYKSVDSTITNITRYTSEPNSEHLIDNNVVSTDDSVYPIYMWYDQTNTTIYWYTKANNIYYNQDASSFYSRLRNINLISNMSDISSKYVTDMSDMFYQTGVSSLEFTLDLGDKFDTSNVTNMYRMFYYTGKESKTFTLNLGNEFDTSNVTNMAHMFNYVGAESADFTLDLGNKFDTSQVTDMKAMFNGTGRNCSVFTLDLGEKFDTTNVTNMQNMFAAVGFKSTIFTLDLGSKFDTRNVTTMWGLFSAVGSNNPFFNLDLGSKFDTSKVTNMGFMFQEIGFNSPSFTIDLGDKFDTSNVTNMNGMFYYAGYNSTDFNIIFGDKFDTSNVIIMNGMFEGAGYSTLNFILDLGDKFDTSKVTNMNNLFKDSRYLTTIYVPTTFVTTAVTESSNMFTGCTNLVGGSGTVFDSSHIDKGYAHIDGGPDNPGYFTDRVVLNRID